MNIKLRFEQNNAHFIQIKRQNKEIFTSFQHHSSCDDKLINIILTYRLFIVLYEKLSGIIC